MKAITTYEVHTCRIDPRTQEAYSIPESITSYDTREEANAERERRGEMAMIVVIENHPATEQTAGGAR